MGLQFRKSIQILPGVKLNISKSGVGISTGIKGLHASINSKGQVRGTASIPGTGVRYTKTIKATDLLAMAKGEDPKAKKKTKKDEEKKPVKENLAVKEEKKEELPEAPKVTKAKKNELAQAIMDIYAIGDQEIQWIAIKNSSSNIGYEGWDYLKERADKVLAGDIDTYLEIINDVNPFDELIAMGSTFECGTDNPMKMCVECTVHGEDVLGESKDDKDLLEDYVAGTAIKAARDIFALLPLWQVEVTCKDDEKMLLHIRFTRDSFDMLNFEKIDASDTIRKLGGILSV